MKHHIENWDPENVDAWEAGGKHVARRNLIWSVVAEHVGFSIWSVWSVMVLFMPTEVYGIDAAGKFALVAVPTLFGSLLRIPYTVATARFGGRNWTIFSALVLLVPTVATLVLMLNPGASYTTFLIVAALAGVGGGNFASSMANINSFYPQRLKGWALGLNAGGGNLGVPVIQLIGLGVIAVAGNRAPYLVCAVYLVFIAVAALGAALFMDNLADQHADLRSMATALRRPRSWAICFLYIGTFGSFIGFSFAFGQVLAIHFTEGGATPAQASLQAAQIAFIGPLLGSVARPFGGKLADRIGGGKITLCTFAGMALAALLLVLGDSMAVLTAGFVALFLLSGIGNGSVYKMIPTTFAGEGARTAQPLTGALIGFAGAVGGLGGVGINLVLRASYAGESGTATAAFAVFGGFYLACIAVTWATFLRQPATASVAVPA
ncbi:MFS transporter [Tomitella biformata]|uniref:MFS transporter n=1 Tax=Tomitella biformata TaxID=630403 RepID=UPI00046549DE|nr:MFS transporter [Tomitella biformata]